MDRKNSPVQAICSDSLYERGSQFFDVREVRQEILVGLIDSHIVGTPAVPTWASIQSNRQRHAESEPEVVNGSPCHSH
jgi:hypothetical protein